MQMIDKGNLDLDSSSVSARKIPIDSVRFLQNFGSGNTFLGIQAGNFTMTGTNNTAVGEDRASERYGRR